MVPRLLESILGSYSSLERVILLVLRTLTEVAPPLTVPSSTRGRGTSTGIAQASVSLLWTATQEEKTTLLLLG